MTYSELIAEVSTALDIPQNDVKRVLDSTFDIMSDSLTSGHPVKITYFGTFLATRRLGRRAVNISTGEKMMIPPSVVVKFRPSGKLKELIGKALPL